MLLSFNSIKPKVYSKTFIQGVIVRYKFTRKKQLDENFASSVSNFISDLFGVEKEMTVEAIKNGFALNNNKNGISYCLRNEEIWVVVSGKDYEKFSVSVIPYLFPLEHYLKNIEGIDTVDSVEIRKINAFPFLQKGDGHFTKSEFIQKSLSQGLTSEAVDYKGDDVFFSENGFKHLDVNDNERDYDISFGVASYKKDDSYAILYLDISAHANNFSIIDSDDSMIALNAKLFDAFHWCVSESIIEMMNKE